MLLCLSCVLSQSASAQATSAARPLPVGHTLFQPEPLHAAGVDGAPFSTLLLPVPDPKGSLDAALKQSNAAVTGALVGAGVGAGLSALAVLAICDADNCLTHPDTWKIAALGVGTGTVVGFLAGTVVGTMRRR